MNKSQFKKLMSRIRYNATDFGEVGKYCKIEYIENFLKEELDEGEEEKDGKFTPSQIAGKEFFYCPNCGESCHKCYADIHRSQKFSPTQPLQEPPLEKFCRMAYPCKPLLEESDIEKDIHATGKRMTAEDLEKAFQWFHKNDPQREKGWEIRISHVRFRNGWEEADKLAAEGWEPAGYSSGAILFKRPK